MCIVVAVIVAGVSPSHKLSPLLTGGKREVLFINSVYITLPIYTVHTLLSPAALHQYQQGLQHPAPNAQTAHHAVGPLMPTAS